MEVRPRAPTLLGLSLVLATQDILEMEQLAQVLAFLSIFFFHDDLFFFGCAFFYYPTLFFLLLLFFLFLLLFLSVRNRHQ